MNKPRAQQRRPEAGTRKPSKARKTSRGYGNRSWFAQHQEVAVDSLSRLLNEPGPSLLTWSVIGIALALPLCLLLFLQNLAQLNVSLDEAGDISLFMAMDVEDDNLVVFSRELLAREDVSGVDIISASDALAEFQATSGFGNALVGLEENPLPAVLVVTPDMNTVASLPQLAAELEDHPLVASAQVDLAWIQRLYAITGLAERLATGLALLLCLGVVLAVGNTVRLAIENRRDEVVVVKLVGGTDAFVARPFLYTGLWFGVGGGLIAAFLVLIAFLLLSGPFSRLMALYESGFTLSGLGVSDVLVLLVVSGGLGLFGAWISVLRHLRAIEPR